MIKKYFLSFMGIEKEVTKEEYIKAERSCGFYSKFGPDHEATGGFGSGEIHGSVRHVAEPIAKPSYLKCDDCGKQDATVREDICPYAFEINDKQVDITICPDCYHERAMDI